MANIPDPAQPDKITADTEFEIHAVFVKEHGLISTWLEAEANEALGAITATQESANAKTTDLMNQIEAVFCRKIDRKPSLLVAASDGTLQGYVPSRGSILSFNITRVLAFFSEVALATTVMLLGQANGVFVLASLLLALGGLALGHGMGGLLERGWRGSLPASLAAKTTDGVVLYYLETIAGAVVVVGISVLRGIEETDLGAMIFVVTLPLLLALLITLFEALYVLAKAKYDFLRKQMADAQRWFAIDNHREGLEKYRTSYASKVAEIALKTQRAVGKVA